MQINFLHIVTFVGISQGIFLAVFLLLKRGKTLINLPLVIYILLMSINLSSTLFLNEGITPSLFGFFYMNELCNLLYGLLIFIYTRNRIEERVVLKKNDLWFLIPLILYFSYYLLLYEDVSCDVKSYLSGGIEFSEHIGEWIFETIVNVGFLIASLRILRNYHKQLRQSYSALEKISFTATRNLIVICLTVYAVEVLLIFLLMIGIQAAGLYHNIIYTLFIVTLFAFGYNELIYSNIVAAPVIKEEKYKKSNLKADSSKQIAESLGRYMQEHKPYLNSEITLKNLSELVGEQPHTLSQVINENFGQNYYEFINSYRIEEAKRIMKEPAFQDYTLTAIGFEAGFNSKSAFYTAFKKATNETPAKYMR